jgi:glycosyltransferase involved in cell wall biosynthesis
MYRAVMSAMNHPDPINPFVGLFNRRSFEAIADAGVDVRTVAPRPYAPPVGPYSEYGDVPARYRYPQYTVHYPRFAYLLPQRVFRYTLSSMSISRTLPSFLDRTVEVPDVCHAGHVHYDGYGLLPYCRDHDVPLTVMGRGTLLNTYEETSDRGRAKIRETLTFADHVFCVSEALAERAGAITDPGKVSVLANGADPSRYPTDREADIRAELGIGPDSVVITFCGGYVEDKGIDTMIAALDAVPPGDVTFVFVGHHGPLRGRLVGALNGSHHETYRVRWKEPPVALRRWFAVSDVYMLPSRSEGRPNTIYEAMASETAVVASTVGGIPEQVEDGETGILIPPDRPAALADALNALIEDDDRREEMGTNGRRRLESQGWGWAAHADRVIEVHESLI